jgi:hypothetical protein
MFPVQNGLKQGDDFGQVGGEDWGGQASEMVELGTHSEGTKKQRINVPYFCKSLFGAFDVFLPVFQH